MNREIVTGSRLVQFKQLRRNWQQHQQRIKRIKPTFRTRRLDPPISHRPKLNRSQLLEVQIVNKALLRKLTQRKPLRMESTLLYSAAHNNRKKYYEDYQRKIENEGIFRRLKQAKTCYRADQFLSSRKEQQKYLNTISRFGYGNLKRTRTFLKFQMNNDHSKYKLDGICKESARQKEDSFCSRNLFNGSVRYFERVVSGYDTAIKVSLQQHTVHLQLKMQNNKQNPSQSFEVSIERTFFNQRYSGSIQRLIDSIGYNSKIHSFVIG